MFERKAAILTITLALAGCGGPGAQANAEEPTHVAETPSDEVPSPPVAWEEMSMEDRGTWMGTEVLPRMRVIFQEHDSERYASFGCPTCHGPNPRERNFEMPSPALPALYPTGAPEQQQMVREHPEMVRLMFRHVVPTMQTLLGAQPYNAETQQGFSCYACHPHAGEPGTTPIHLNNAPDAAP